MPFAAAAQPGSADDRPTLGDGESPHRVTLLELFFDLVFVVALALISHELIANVSWHGAFHTLILLMAIWWVWAITTTVTNLYDPHQPEIKLLILAVMAGTLLMATMISGAFHTRAPIFAVTYVAIHVGRGLVLIYTARHDAPVCRRAARITIWFAVSAVPWLVGGFVGEGTQQALWLLALAIDYAGLRLAYPVPGLGAVPSTQRAVAAGHLSERYQQFFTIALGDCILVIGLVFSASRSARANVPAFAVAFLTTVLLWRIYVHRSGALLPAAIRASMDPSRFLHTAPYTHLPMIAGVVVTAAGFDLILHHPTGRTPPAWVAVLLGGPALFLAGRALFEYEVFSRVSHSRPGGLLALLAFAPWALFVPPLATAVGGMLVLAGVAAADTRRSWGRPVERPVPPG